MSSTERLVVDGARQSARTIANAYERLRWQHPRLSYPELLQIIIPDGAARMPSLWKAINAPRSVGLDRFASEVASHWHSDLRGVEAEAVSATVQDEIRKALGYVPDGSDESRRQDQARDAYLRTDEGYRQYLQSTFGINGPYGEPELSVENRALSTNNEWQQALNEVYRLGLPVHFQGQKNWDGLAAISCVLRRTGRDASILEAGTELYSVVLPSLFLYGYRNLTGNNLVFEEPCRLGPISYEQGDITATKYGAETFDAVTCLSVIEHGVDLGAYFREMFRILKPGGVLITSTDYFPDPVETGGAMAYGVPVRIFSKPDIVAALDTANSCGFELTGPIELECLERPVSWPEFSLDYSFILFTLQKQAA